MDPRLSDDIAALCDEIIALLDEPVRQGGDALVRLEDTLTSGYARALALEAERLRLERRISDVGGELQTGAEGRSGELESLATRLSEASSRLERLRSMLAALRRRAEAVRAVA